MTIGTKGRHKRRGFVLRAVIPQRIGDALKSHYVASENKKADMHTKRLARKSKVRLDFTSPLATTLTQLTGYTCHPLASLQV